MSQTIGLTGYAGAGKDEAARALLGIGYERRAFADPLRACVLTLDPVIGLPGGTFERLSIVVEAEGWDAAKRAYPEVRRLLQVFGTEVVRAHFGSSAWIDIARGTMLPGVDYVFTDCRFPNEVEMIHQAGGVVLGIMRPGVSPVNAHASDDIGALHVDHVVANDGSIDELHARVLDIVAPVVIPRSGASYKHGDRNQPPRYTLPDDFTNRTGPYARGVDSHPTYGTWGRNEGEDIERLERGV